MVKVGSLFTQVLSLINRNDFARAVRPWGAARPRSQGLWSNFSSELVQDNRLEFRDFGVFEPRTREARVAQNPKTLEKVKVPAKRTVKFKMGRMMRERLSDGVVAHG